ncbi:hypothetical protein SAY87_015090 [Trapa incisa]|uniref:Pyruvate kinase barrel domain-containing protein n=1 Tax=Trapa incisa TaxID=236973 RepID=A0AAN7GTP1_9MYRT|nr:hypothetical protein SAY87_015090 [Trapa incisa]
MEFDKPSSGDWIFVFIYKSKMSHNWIHPSSTTTTDYTIKSNSEMISMRYRKRNTILCADGTITLTVLSCDLVTGTVWCCCENTATLGERKKVNLPRVVVDLLTLIEKDKKIFYIGIENRRESSTLMNRRD